MSRVVITGLGAVTPLGLNVKQSWSALCKGISAIRSTNLLGPAFASLPSRVAAWIEESKLPPLFALIAAEEALMDSGLGTNHQSMGACIGSGMAPLDLIINAGYTLRDNGSRKVNPHLIPRILPNMAAGHVSIAFNLHGPLLSPSTACATGVHAIGEAFRWIKHGYCKAMMAGATESAVNELSMAGFCQARALSTSFNHHPETASRPFSKQRDGFVISEGAGMIVLEEMEHARARGAKIYGEIVGFGASADGYHITASHPEGEGAERAMKSALKEANINASQVDLVNVHATSTPLGDVAEAMALKRLFPHLPRISANKGAIGHLLGGAGAIETIFATLSMQNSIIPPSLNCGELDEECIGLNLVTDQSNASMQYFVKNSFGFGGTNASLCMLNTT